MNNISGLKKQSKRYRVSIIGTGFIGRGLMRAIKRHPHLELSLVVSRSAHARSDLSISMEHVTDDIEKVIRDSDIVVSCAGEPIYAAPIVEKILEANIPVVTMDSELQITVGSYLARKGVCVEAEGDQPGSLAALDEEARSMGFTPIVYGNSKGFLNHDPTHEEMTHWANKSGNSIKQITSFTDGTKIQIEQALVANGLGASIVHRGLAGPSCETVSAGAFELAKLSESLGKPISDYILCPSAGGSVFIVAKHDSAEHDSLKYLKLGDGPYYILLKPFHLCHLEITKTIMRVLERHGSWGFNNGTTPSVQVMTLAKHDFKIGDSISRGIGSFDVRGEAVFIKDYKNSVPIGVLENARVTKPINKGEMITFGNIELPETRALAMWQEMLYNKSFKN
ncbi:MAG: NAD(P)-dependent oxidoreductase [Patescibacteria group bacterium]